MKPTRFLRFSLRSLIVTITLVCSLLGYWRYQVAQHRSAVEVVRRNGGEIQFDYEREEIDNWLVHQALWNSLKVEPKLRPLAWHSRLAKSYPEEFAYVWAVRFADKVSLSEVEFCALRRFSRLKVLDVGGESFASINAPVRQKSPLEYQGHELEIYLEQQGAMPVVPRVESELLKTIRRRSEAALSKRTILDAEWRDQQIEVDRQNNRSSVDGNEPPVALDDIIGDQLNRVEPVVIDVLANDFDPEGGPLHIVGVAQPLDGYVTFTREMVTYHPPGPPAPGGANKPGTDPDVSFNYIVSDEKGKLAVGKVVGY